MVNKQNVELEECEREEKVKYEFRMVYLCHRHLTAFFSEM